MRNKIMSLAAFLAVMLAMTGLAAAAPVTPTLMQASPNQNSIAPNPLSVGVNVGDSLTLSLKLDAMLDTNFSVTCTLTPVVGPVGGITVACPAYVDTGVPVVTYTALDSIVLTNNGAPAGSLYSLKVDVAGVTITRDIGTETRDVSVPEFPTVALPVAAVIGLVFLFQSRKNKKE